MIQKEILPVTLITTVWNEENSIYNLIDSIENQSVHPYEVIIVDGGSRDKTIELIKSKVEEVSFNLKLFCLPSANIAKGRNFAINKAEKEVIACTDSGCKLKENWLYEITKNILNGRNEVIAGVTQREYPVNFVEEIIYYSYNIPEIAFENQIINKYNFIKQISASSRSIAFNKKVWGIIKGYPEHLKRCGEDTLFNYKIVNQGFQIKFETLASVTWENEKTLISLLKKNMCYGYGDGESGIVDYLYFTRTIKIIIALIILAISVYYPHPFFIITILCTVSYYFYLRSFYKKELLKRPILFLSIFLFNYVAEAAKLLGYIFGKLKLR